MRRILAIVILFLVRVPCHAVPPDLDAARGPTLLARGDGSFIHAFEGAVDGFHSRPSRVIRPGVVIVHTRADTGRATWMIRTGTVEMPTRRLSFAVSRLVGVYLTESRLAAVVCDSGRVWDRTPPVLPPDRATYRLLVFDTSTGAMVSEIGLDVASSRPERVPEETTSLGVFEKTDAGFTVLGTAMIVEDDGGMHPATRRPSADEER